MAEVASPSRSSSSAVAGSGSGSGSTVSCRGAAIRGSSLVSLSVCLSQSVSLSAAELRHSLRCGLSLSINGAPHRTHASRPPATWPAQCIELDSDFLGETDFDARIEWQTDLDFRDRDRESPFKSPSGKSGKKKSSKKKTTDVDGEVDVKNTERDGEKGRKPHRLTPIVHVEVNANDKEDTNTNAITSARALKEVGKGSASSNNNGGKLNPLVKTDSFRTRQKRAKEDRVAAASQENHVSNNQENLADSNNNEQGLVEDQLVASEPVPPNKPISKASEARRIARERVLKKLKEDREHAEQLEKEKIDKVTKIVEGNQMKIKILQEKTLERVQLYQESLKYKAIEERSRVEEEEFKRFQSNQNAVSDEAQQKMHALRKETTRRRKLQQQKLLEIENEKEAEYQQRLKSNAKKFEVASTILAHQALQGSKKPLKEVNSEAASQDLRHHLSAILGDTTSSYNGDPQDIDQYVDVDAEGFAGQNGKLTPPMVNPTRVPSKGISSDDSAYALSAQNLFRLQQQQDQLTSTNIRPSSESALLPSSKTSDHGTHVRNGEHFIGMPSYAFSEDEDSLATPTRSSLPKQNKKAISPQKSVAFSSTVAKVMDDDSLIQAGLKDSPQKWLEQQLGEEDDFSDDLDWTPPQRNSPVKQQLKSKKDSDSDSDLSDLTDHEGRKRERVPVPSQGTQSATNSVKQSIGASNNKPKLDLEVKFSPRAHANAAKLKIESKPSAGSPSKSEQSSNSAGPPIPKKKKAVFKKLPPIPIGPYQPIQAVSER